MWLMRQLELTATRPRVRGNFFPCILGGITSLLISALCFYRAATGNAFYRNAGAFEVLTGVLFILYGVTETKLRGSPWRWVSRATLLPLALLLLLAILHPILP